MYLPATVPEVKREIAQELHTTMLNIDGSSQPAHVSWSVVAEYDGAHGRLSSATLAHK